MLTLENAVLYNSAEKDVVSVLDPLAPVPCHSTQTAHRHTGETSLSELCCSVLAENISYTANTQPANMKFKFKNLHKEVYYSLIKWNRITNIHCSLFQRESLELASLGRIEDYLDLHTCISQPETKS